jgi:hypothetical protein
MALILNDQKEYKANKKRNAVLEFRETQRKTLGNKVSCVKPSP